MRPLACVGALLFVYALILAASAYRAGAFTYHDLALINDFLANTAFGHGAFFVTDLGVSHLTIHFTPTLWLLVPFYRVFDSQFLLIVLGGIGIAVSCAFQVAIFLRVLEHVCPGEGQLRRWAPFGFLILSACNMYSKSVFFSSHFEVFYMPFASMLLWMLLRGFGMVSVLLAAIPALGVREDAGLYLLFLAASTLLLPAGLVEDRRRLRLNVIAICTVAALYIVVAVKVLMPMCGAPLNVHVERFWSQYGGTWQAVLLSMLTHPWRVICSAATSGWLLLLSELAFLPLLSFRSFFVGTVPGLLLFTASSTDKHLLHFYNSAWLLPSALLATGVGMARIVAYQKKAPPVIAKAIHVLMIVVPIVFVVRPDNAGGPGPFWFRSDPHLPAPGLIREVVAACPSVRSVAADFDSVVFVPNRYSKYTLHNFMKADAIVFDSRSRVLLSGGSSLADVRSEIEKSGGFRLLGQRAEARAYVAQGINCSTQAFPNPARE